MSPTLSDGDYILTVKPRHLVLGLIYVIHHADLGVIIKRLGGQGINSRGEAYFLFSGDDPQSTPQAVIGPVTRDRIVGRAILTITPNGIKRLRAR